jgi:hypothetical protein
MRPWWDWSSSSPPAPNTQTLLVLNAVTPVSCPEPLSRWATLQLLPFQCKMPWMSPPAAPAGAVTCTGGAAPVVRAAPSLTG